MALYTQEHHQVAFDAWYEYRSWTRVAAAIGPKCTYTTPKRWATAEYSCPFNCPWHNWDALVRERDRAMNERVKLLQNGNFDILDHEKAMKTAIADMRDTGDEIQNADPVLLSLRTDMERLSHWEYLYGKVFYDATGIPITYGKIVEEVAVIKYQGGLRSTSLEGAIKMLAVIQDRIDGLKGSSKREEEVVEKEAKKLSIEDLRKMRSLPPSKLQEMAALKKNLADGTRSNTGA